MNVERMKQRYANGEKRNAVAVDSGNTGIVEVPQYAHKTNPPPCLWSRLVSGASPTATQYRKVVNLP